MKSRISFKFEELKKKRQKALITYITAGDPSMAVTEKLVWELERAGADIIELGVPFSDPLADGPTIQASHARALEKGVSLEGVLKLVKKVGAGLKVPIVLMLSYNLILKYGVDEFVRDSGVAGVDGVIAPDLSVEESGKLRGMSRSIDTIFLVSPTSSDERIDAISKASSGFIYLVSLTGITGARRAMSSDIENNVSRIRALTNKPVAVGFGISNPSQVLEITRFSDGVIVGSAIVKVIADHKGRGNLVKKVGDLVRRLKKACSK